MSIIHNRCVFADKQVVRLQETPGEINLSSLFSPSNILSHLFSFVLFHSLFLSLETDPSRFLPPSLPFLLLSRRSDAVPDGQTPHTVSLCVYDELVDLTKPGDRVMVTGIFRSIPVRVNPRMRTIKALFKTYIDVVHIKRTNATRMGYDPTTRQGEGKPPGVGVGGEEDEEEELANGARRTGAAGEEQNVGNVEMERKLLELSEREDIYELLSRSLAPSIWEMDDVKKGILLQLFGGTNKNIAKGGGGGGPRYRGDINVLMVGDPGTSKSQILKVSSTPPFRRVFRSRSFADFFSFFFRCVFPVRQQDRSSRCLHLRKGILGRRSDRLHHSRSRFQAARS